MTLKRKQSSARDLSVGFKNGLPAETITRTVNCGRCAQCLKKKQLDWAFRLTHELQNSESACFLTLTYDDETVPVASAGYSLLRKDFQDFMKRLRKHANRTKIKYYACGEYGENTERPHYHAIVFNLPRPFDKYVDKAWKHGHIHIGTVNEASIMYTTKYTLKGLKRRKAEEVDEFGREPEFTLMSNGLGIGYIKNEIVRYLRQNGTKLLTLQGGVKKKLPRYYIEKMFTDPTELALWRAAANSELQSHTTGEDLTDKQRSELIDLYEYRNNRTIKKGSRI